MGLNLGFQNKLWPFLAGNVGLGFQHQLACLLQVYEAGTIAFVTGGVRIRVFKVESEIS